MQTPPETALPALQVSELTVAYGQQVAVAGVSLQIERGEIFGLLGPNGAGRTSTLGAIEGLVHAWFDDAPGRHASIWVSHDPAQATRMSERHLIMRAGVLDETARHEAAPVHHDHPEPGQ